MPGVFDHASDLERYMYYRLPRPIGEGEREYTFG